MDRLKAHPVWKEFFETLPPKMQYEILTITDGIEYVDLIGRLDAFAREKGKLVVPHHIFKNIKTDNKWCIINEYQGADRFDTFEEAHQELTIKMWDEIHKAA